MLRLRLTLRSCDLRLAILSSNDPEVANHKLDCALATLSLRHIRPHCGDLKLTQTLTLLGLDCSSSGCQKITILQVPPHAPTLTCVMCRLCQLDLIMKPFFLRHDHRRYIHPTGLSTLVFDLSWAKTPKKSKCYCCPGFLHDSIESLSMLSAYRLATLCEDFCVASNDPPSWHAPEWYFEQKIPAHCSYRTKGL